jgi:hypothetical protein
MYFVEEVIAAKIFTSQSDKSTEAILLGAWLETTAVRRSACSQRPDGFNSTGQKKEYEGGGAYNSGLHGRAEAA